MNLLQAAHTPRSDVIVASNTRACQHAFSSGSISYPKTLSRRCHTVRVNKQRATHIVHAAAATDIGTKAVQAIKKSVGGDIFVAGRSLSCQVHTAKESRCHALIGYKTDAFSTDVQVAMVKSQHGSCRSSYVTALKSLQVRSCAHPLRHEPTNVCTEDQPLLSSFACCVWPLTIPPCCLHRRFRY